MIASKNPINRKQLEDSFSLGEANVALEGFEPKQHPLYATLKEQVLSGEITASEMGDEILAYAMRQQASSTAA